MWFVLKVERAFHFFFFFSSVFQPNFCFVHRDGKTFLVSKEEEGNRQKSIAFQYISVEIFLSGSFYFSLAWNKRKNCAIQIWARSPIFSSSIFCWSRAWYWRYLHFRLHFYSSFSVHFLVFTAHGVHNFTYRLLLVLQRNWRESSTRREWKEKTFNATFDWFTTPDFIINFFACLLAFLLSSTFCLRSSAAIWPVQPAHR